MGAWRRRRAWDRLSFILPGKSGRVLGGKVDNEKGKSKNEDDRENPDNVIKVISSRSISSEKTIIESVFERRNDET